MERAQSISLTSVDPLAAHGGHARASCHKVRAAHNLHT
jgi:hypothetical protein